MSEPNIELRELNKSNYRDILKLKVADNQTGFVASNAISLAQALFHSQAWYRGIYQGETAVGFVMLELDMEKPEYYLWRYMIDEKFQGHGYGFKALELVIEYVKSLPDSTEFLLSYVPKEGNPKGFYEKLGFFDTGEMEEGEVIMKLEFK
ncbi:MAG: GNAT family N-acetyltransferase [FCB group bacterium]|nr:GNAT family N-acetyltransferase [FCB group bacterium]MBL7027246.1 GNAT family N-acetyltransferase [Candidatus Neomarinimicrobiota bacterium]MBL7120519.1 GNAT family N-acetyltransferase [Candidatus Neomarinimicrobiota bacterium]